MTRSSESDDVLIGQIRLAGIASTERRRHQRRGVIDACWPFPTLQGPPRSRSSAIGVRDEAFSVLVGCQPSRLAPSAPRPRLLLSIKHRNDQPRPPMLCRVDRLAMRGAGSLPTSVTLLSVHFWSVLSAFDGPTLYTSGRRLSACPVTRHRKERRLCSIAPLGRRFARGEYTLSRHARPDVVQPAPYATTASIAVNASPSRLKISPSPEPSFESTSMLSVKRSSGYTPVPYAQVAILILVRLAEPSESLI